MLLRLATPALLVSNALAQWQQVLSDRPTDSHSKRAITEEISELAAKLVKETQLPGISIGVVHSDNNVELKSWGISSEDGFNMTTDTLFDIASCSKAFLSASLGILIDDFARGRNVTGLPPSVRTFDWYTKVVGLLPGDWKLMDEWASQKASLRDVLSHQSGIPRHDFSYGPKDKPIDVLHRMQHLRPAFELRQRWHYNNQMYMLGAHLISTYSGRPYTQFVKERIWDPLNMTSTTFSAKQAAHSGRLTHTWTSLGRRIPFWFPDEWIELNAGPGGIISSVVDLTKWIRTMVNEGVDPMTNKTIVPRSAYQEVTTAHKLVDGLSSQPYFSMEGYGMGWSRKSYQGHEFIAHSGAIPGFSAEVFFFPSDKLGVVALANAGGTHAQELAVIYRIVEDYLGLERKESERLISAIAEEISPPPSVAPEESAPSQSPLSLPLSSYAGEYYDAGYGTYNLCAPTADPSPSCADVLASWAPFDNVTDEANIVLYASVSSIWISHIRLTHKDGNAFAIHGTWLFPHGYGADSTPFLLDELEDAPARGEFWVRDGQVLGLAMNGFVGERTERQRLGGTVEDTAEIWFTKV